MGRVGGCYFEAILLLLPFDRVDTEYCYFLYNQEGTGNKHSAIEADIWASPHTQTEFERIGAQGW